MFTKALFLVLLGTALVLANPVPASDNKEVAPKSDVEANKPVGAHEDEDDESLDIGGLFDELANQDEATTVAPKVSVWKKLANKWNKFVETTKSKFAGFKHKWIALKEKGLKFIKEAKETYEEIKKQGKEAIAELKDVYKTAKETWLELKKTGKETYEEVKALLSEVKTAIRGVKSKWSSGKKE